jgi:hypothetical protein
MMSRCIALLLGSLASAAASGYCNDKDPSCGPWGRDGECEGENAEHVKTLCPHT